MNNAGTSLFAATEEASGFYCATKWAVEALHESLAQEADEWFFTAGGTE